MTVLALDFDGVLCDSVDETAVSAWRAGSLLWGDMVGQRPPAALLEAYRQTRPAVETGYQAILAMRLLLDGEPTERVLEGFSERAAEILSTSGLDREALKGLFGETRDRWLDDAPEEWQRMSPFYPGVGEWLRSLPESAAVYIVTTKERRFVERLLAGNGVEFDAQRIYGLEASKPKELILSELLELHPSKGVCFVEDRFATLERCLARPDLSGVAPRLAAWGYNTATERVQAERLGIPVWRLSDLLNVFGSENDIEQ